MSLLQDKTVVLGVSGGIAAYKAAGLVRAYRAAGADVHVVMTRSAEEFIPPLTLQVLSENRVGRSLFEPGYEYEIGHIQLARAADVVVIAPATANVIARVRAGMADDLLTTVVLATTAPVVVCPAMNTQMLRNAATVENLAVLQDRGMHVLDPDAGALACHEVGPGRLPDPPVVLAATARALSGQPLAGRRITVTAGPTREAFDPVRFVSNRSSGRMGYAVAAAAWELGADVTLIHGPTGLDVPPGVRPVPVTTAAELHDAVHATPGDVLVMAAAVADWRPADVATEKRKKGEAWAPAFERTTDVLASLDGAPNRPRAVIGFAAETERHLEHGRDKLLRKKLDGIVVNDVGGPNGAFGNATNAVTLLAPGRDPVQVERAPKHDVAHAILRWIAEVAP